MLELFMDPIVAFIIYLLGSIVCWIIAYVSVNRKTNTKLLIGAIFMTLSIAFLSLTLNNICGNNTDMKLFIPIGCIIWSFICLSVLQKRYNGVE